jgi:hypothetical protein
MKVILASRLAVDLVKGNGLTPSLPLVQRLECHRVLCSMFGGQYLVNGSRNLICTYYDRLEKRIIWSGTVLLIF